jgi:dCMP deaminase
MKTKFKSLYMDFATRVAELSHARRLKVGAVVVKDDRVISIGYNGMPSGWDNTCEDKEYAFGNAEAWQDSDMIAERWPLVEYQGEFQDQPAYYRLVTKPEVLHAEMNALAKLAKSNDSGIGADLFVTHSPCIECAKLIYQSGIKRVFYQSSYRDDTGIRFLMNSGVGVEQLE